MQDTRSLRMAPRLENTALPDLDLHPSAGVCAEAPFHIWKAAQRPHQAGVLVGLHRTFPRSTGWQVKKTFGRLISQLTAFWLATGALRSFTMDQAPGSVEKTEISLLQWLKPLCHPSMCSSPNAHPHLARFGQISAQRCALVVRKAGSSLSKWGGPGSLFLAPVLQWRGRQRCGQVCRRRLPGGGYGCIYEKF